MAQNLFGGSPRMFMQQDPTIARRYEMAQALQQAGTDTSPVQHPFQALARVAQGFSGGLQANRIEDEMKDRQKAFNDQIVDALRKVRGGTPINPDAALGAEAASGGQPGPTVAAADRIGQPAQPGGVDALVEALAGNPDTAPLALQMQMGQITSQQDMDRALQLAQQKQKLKPPKTRTVKRDGVEVTEQWNPATRTFEEVGQSGIGLISDDAEAQKRRIAESGRAQNVGTIPPGYQLRTGADTMRMEPIPGSPAAAEAEALADKEAGRTAQTRRAGTTVVQDLGRALEIVPEMAQGEGVVGANLRSARAGIKGTPEYQATLFKESALSNVGLDTLQQMRENSPTGGALGQVPIQQQQRLEQVLGSLDITQPPAVFEANMKRIMNVYTDIMFGSPEERERAIRAGELTPEENAEIEARYFDLPFDEMGRPVAQPSDLPDFSAMPPNELYQVDIDSLQTQEEIEAYMKAIDRATGNGR